MEARQLQQPEIPCSQKCPLYKTSPYSQARSDKWKAPQQCSLDQLTQSKKLYTRLGDWQIRVLALHPAARDDSLEATLHIAANLLESGTVLLESNLHIKYEALSYCWGEPCFDVAIRCNNIAFPITRNLYSALQYLRREHEVRYLWIDALCINQHDPQERSMQVTKMLSIYQRAKHVVVWLETQTAHTMVISQYIQQHCRNGRKRLSDQHGMKLPIYDRLRNNTGEDISTDILDTGRAYNIRNSYDQGAIKTLFEADAQDLWCTNHNQVLTSGVHDLLSRPWYDRLWIIQEVWGAKDITFACGSFVLHWSELQAIAEEMTTTLIAFDANFRSPFLRLLRSPYLRPKPEQPTSTPHEGFSSDPEDNVPARDLLHVIQRTSSSKCANPKDHIYGIIGMTDVEFRRSGAALDDNGLYLLIDYRRSIREVYVDAFEIFLKRDYLFSVLEKILSATPQIEGQQLLGGQVEGETLPSWCPNWSVPFQFEITFGEWTRLRKNKLRSAYIRDASVLCLFGIRIGTIKKYRGLSDRSYSPEHAFSLACDNSSSERFRMILEEYDDFWLSEDGDFKTIGPLSSQIGDIVVVVDSWCSTVILRPSTTSSRYTFVSVMPLNPFRDRESSRYRLYKDLSAVDEPIEQFDIV